MTTGTKMIIGPCGLRHASVPGPTHACTLWREAADRSQKDHAQMRNMWLLVLHEHRKGVAK